MSSQVIRNITDYHTQLINRTRHGDMILPGQTLYVMECAPAGYAALAANEAEKAADINILEVRAFGSFGPRVPGRRGAGHRRRLAAPPRRRSTALDGRRGRQGSRMDAQQDAASSTTETGET